MSSTRILSWEQLVLESDPGFARSRLQPWLYEMSNGRRFYAPIGIYDPLPSGDLGNDGGVLYLLNLNNDGAYPNGDDGLAPGAVYSLGGAIGVTPGSTPQPGAAAMIFGRITASQLLMFGAGNLATTQPPADSLQLWNLGGLICVA